MGVLEGLKKIVKIKDVKHLDTIKSNDLTLTLYNSYLSKQSIVHMKY